MSETLPISQFQKQEAEPLARGIARQRSYRSIFDAVRTCQEQGLMASDHETEEITAVLWATVHGHVSLELAGFHESQEAATSRFLLLTQSVLAGLLTPKGTNAWKAFLQA